MNDITTEELKERLDNGETLNLIDVREDWERSEFNIGGQHIALATLPAVLVDLQDLKDQEVFVYCRSGGRSGQAKQLLTQLGFSNVRNVLGGMMRWQELYGSQQP